MIRNFPTPGAPIGVPPENNNFSLQFILDNGSAQNPSVNSTLQAALILQDYLASLEFCDIGNLAVNTVGMGQGYMILLSNIFPKIGEGGPLTTSQALAITQPLYLHLWLPGSDETMEGGDWHNVAAILNIIHSTTADHNLYQGTKRFLQDFWGLSLATDQSPVFQKSTASVMGALMTNSITKFSSQTLVASSKGVAAGGEVKIRKTVPAPETPTLNPGRDPNVHTPFLDAGDKPTTTTTDPAPETITPDDSAA